MTAARGALCAAAAVLLLLAAAGCHSMGGCSHLHQAADLWASQAQERAAAWWAAARGPPAAASVAGAEWQLGGAAAASDALQQPGLMHVTLELPGGRRLGVGEDASLKDLVAHLLQEQTGLQPSSIEVVSVEHVRQRRLSPLRAMLRAAAALRRPSAWRLPGAAPPPADDGFVDVSELAAGLGAGSSLEALAGGDVQALLQQLEPGSSSSATAEPQPPLTEALVAQKTADALAASAKQQRPASLTVEAAAQEERWASGRKLQQDAPMAPPCQHMRLFGPARSAAELRGDADANGPVSAPPVAAVVLHVVVVEQRASRQQRLWSLLARLADDAASSGSSDSGNGSTDSGSMDSALGSPQRASLLNLLDQAELLELPLGDPAPLLGRRALPAAPHPLADGIPVAGLLEPFGAPPRRPQLQLPLQRARPAVQQGRAAAGPSPLALAAVDALFAGACCVAVVCTALLAADIWRNGWRGDGQARRGHPAGCLAAASEAQQQLTVPLLVVAAEEVEAHRCGKC